MFPAQTYVDRRECLKAHFQDGLLLFLGNEDSPMNYTDNAYPFRQDSTFLYYFGIDQPGYAAVIDLDQDRTIVFGHDLSIEDIVWTGSLPTVAELASAVGVQETAPASTLPAYLERAKGRPIRFLPPYRPEHRLKLAGVLGSHATELDALVSLDLVRAIIEMRVVKSAEEISELEKAVDVSVDMHLAAMRMARPGVKESEIAARLTEIALASGGNLGYPNIVTIRGEILHNHSYGNTLQSGQMLLVDAGAETAMRYTADLSSTCPVDPTFTLRQKEVYQIVLNAHFAVVESLKPGIPFRDMHRLACRTIAEGLKDLGLMKGDLDEAVEQGAHALFFPCGVGHMMGLDVHDLENMGEVWVGYEGQPKSTQFGLKSLRLARPLQPGFVLTVEPGIYFIPQLMDRWKAEGKFAEFIDYERLEAYRDFSGMRIEENIVITDNGHRVLGKPRPRTITEVEAAHYGQ
jgi:Xaa-Pro aminopeptidase